MPVTNVEGLALVLVLAYIIVNNNAKRASYVQNNKWPGSLTVCSSTTSPSLLDLSLRFITTGVRSSTQAGKNSSS